MPIHGVARVPYNGGFRALPARAATHPPQSARNRCTEPFCTFPWPVGLWAERSQTLNIIGYARVSTRDPDPRYQEHALTDAGASRVFTDHGDSSRIRNRPAPRTLTVMMPPTFSRWRRPKTNRCVRLFPAVDEHFNGRSGQRIRPGSCCLGELPRYVRSCTVCPAR